MGALLQLVGDALSIHFVNCSCSTSIDNSSRSQHITGSKTRRNGCADHSDTAVLGKSQFYRAFNGFQWVLRISNMTPLRSWNFDAVSGMGHFKRLMPSIASLTCFDFLLYLLSLIIHRLFFCHLFEKHVELPGRNLVQLRDRRAVGDNWREDFIQDCWSLRIGIVTSLILRWYQTDSKSMQVSWCVFFLLQLLHNISLFGYSDTCYVYPIIFHMNRLQLLSLNRWEHWKSEKMQQRFCRLRETSRRPCPSSVCCEALQKVDGFILLTRLLQLLSGADRCFSAIFAHCCILTIIQQCRDISMHYSSFLRLDSRITPLFQGSAFQKWVQDILGWFAFQWSKSMSQLWTSWEDINAANEEKQEEKLIRRLEVTGLRNAGMRERHWNQVGEGDRRHFWMLQNVAIAWLYNAIWYQIWWLINAYYAFVNFSTTHVA